ncbi:MAG: U32 family peptidase [Candidatus Firestonebacteria bacterium]|nr:U32 family peptidase [Candidatus Firestonebacteria bacterium]
MAKFAMPLNWQRDYFDKINFNQVYEVYGKLREDFPGGGKSSMAQAEPSKRLVKETVENAHRRNLQFNYLINSTCISNLELTRKGYKNIRILLDWLSEIGVDKVTLGIPFLVEMVKKHYPDFKVGISTQAGVNTLEKVQYWENIGADSITLSHVEVNRDFKEIKRITENSICDFQLIVNMICKRRCPFVTLHGNFNAHSSQTFTKMNRYNMDYYFLSCLARNFSDPLSIIKANWIRPEDLHIYESLGIKKFKIAERGLTTDALALIIDAYTNKSYDGNMMDLVPTMSKYIFMEKQHFSKSVKELFRLSFVNIFKLKDILKRWGELKKSDNYSQFLGIYIDNKKLDGVINTFKEKDCLNISCRDCNYCEKLAKENVKILGSERQYNLDMDNLNCMLNKLVAGEYF